VVCIQSPRRLHAAVGRILAKPNGEAFFHAGGGSLGFLVISAAI
jgi:hypothetical protein